MSKLENVLEKNNLEKGYQLLTEREKKIISLYYLEGYNDEEIATFYGINQQNVNRQRKRGIVKLKINEPPRSRATGYLLLSKAN